MKSTIRLAVIAAALGFAAPVVAQDVEVTGTAEPICSLPTSWSHASAVGGLGSSNWTGTTLTIPEHLVADSTAHGRTSTAEVATRIRGAAFCNASHTISLTSLNGGLVNGVPEDAAPDGFIKSRRLEYAAHWRQNSGVVGNQMFGLQGWRPTIADRSRQYTYTVNGGTRPVLGSHDFDIRVEILPATAGQVMVAGVYRDELTVTISVNP